MKTKKETTSNSKRSRCGFCLPYGDRKYSVKCDQCKIFVCPKHRTSSTTIKRSFLILIKIDSALDIGR
ncbi:hypothetical protein T4E_10738 [Trichinella pseudospiralis]|uniref:Uncharacterized protein n=1 Tax=Trichinella pseudospiralis TaxID=6337 RepID=A0A0V0Y659_TRIPS|nr:hypothetical protein T4E_10738 [Trichinella pseudospiralis]